MTVINNFYLSEDAFGNFRLAGVETKSTVLGKKNASAEFIQEAERVLYSGDSVLIADFILALAVVTQQGGWANAPIAYFRRHHGWALAIPENPGYGASVMLSICASRSMKH